MAKSGKKRQKGGREKEVRVRRLLRGHFAPHAFGDLTVAERKFPFRVRADLQRAIDRLFADRAAAPHVEGDLGGNGEGGAGGAAGRTRLLRFCGIRKEYAYEGFDFPGLLVGGHYPTVAVPPQYEEVDVGGGEPVRCLKNGLWLLREGDTPYAVLLSPAHRHGETTGVTFQIATAGREEGADLSRRFFKHLEESVLKAESYRGKILSLEQSDSYSGQSTGIRVHKLRTVERERVVLPRKTLDLLDRNVIGFVRNRPRLARLRQATKKGLLFYGPPGTGKTHTLHYLAASLPGHTTLLIAAEQVGLLGEYMTLARLLQPSMVVIEDADLIARDRASMSSPCEEVMLNKLLNEMDGLREDADILFVLTTNRPEALEAALASRPGRVDQAIEFPLPDGEGREKLVRLYSRGVEVPDEVVADVVRRTAGVSGAFIKELMRRSVQFHLESGAEGAASGEIPADGGDSGEISLSDVGRALEEMLFSGGSLNRKLLGGDIGGTNGADDASEAAAGGEPVLTPGGRTG